MRLPAPGLRDREPAVSKSSGAGSAACSYLDSPDQVETAIAAGTPSGKDSKHINPGFLALPLEIRLQIYNWVHLMSLVNEVDLSPWYPAPTYSAYFLAPIITNVFWREEDISTSYHVDRPRTIASSAQEQNDKDMVPLLSPYRPVAYLPSALLRTSRQVYLECRTIPFQANEFVFITWFSSGLSAARGFVGALKPWQRETMRFARLEIQARDLSEALRIDVWEELCSFWAVGMRGLRVTVELDETEPLVVGNSDEDPHGPWWPLRRGNTPRTWQGDEFRWVEGLRKMRRLRELEVEIVGIKAVTDAERLVWCERLGKRLNMERHDRDKVSVVCVAEVSGIVEGGQKILK